MPEAQRSCPTFELGAYINHAKQIGYTPELVLEMALADFLDPEPLTFTDCKPQIGLAAEPESMSL